MHPPTSIAYRGSPTPGHILPTLRVGNSVLLGCLGIAAVEVIPVKDYLVDWLSGT